MLSQERLLTTAELAAARGVSRQAIAQAVKRGTLEPVSRLANGMYLFAQEQVEPEADA